MDAIIKLIEESFKANTDKTFDLLTTIVTLSIIGVTIYFTIKYLIEWGERTGRIRSKNISEPEKMNNILDKFRIDVKSQIETTLNVMNIVQKGLKENIDPTKLFHITQLMFRHLSSYITVRLLEVNSKNRNYNDVKTEVIYIIECTVKEFDAVYYKFPDICHSIVVDTEVKIDVLRTVKPDGLKLLYDKITDEIMSEKCDYNKINSLLEDCISSKWLSTATQ